MSITNGSLETELFTKPTNPQAYLLRTSYHPRHTFKSLPYGEFLRTRRNCSNLTSFETHAKQMYSAFLKRGYKPDILDEALSKARLKDRQTLLEKYDDPDFLNQAFLGTQKTPASTENNFFFITKFHDGIKPVQNLIRDNWHLLGKSPHTEHLFESKLTIGYKRNPRLKDLLVKTQIPLAPLCAGKAGVIIRECPKPGICIYCPLIDTTGKVTSFTKK